MAVSVNGTPQVRDDPTVEYGRSGTLNFKGFLQSQEYNAKLLPPQSFDIYDRMAKSDPVVHATMQHIITPLLAADWEVRPVSKDPIHLEQAAFVNSCMYEWMRRPFIEVLEDQLRYLRHGFSLTEGTYRAERKEWTYTDGANAVKVAERDVLVWDNWAPRMPSTIWKWNVENGLLASIEQQAYDTTGIGQSITVMPADKCLLLVNEQEGDDYWGVSILRGAYKPWYLLENVQRVAAIGMERFLVGTPMARMRSNSTPNQRQETMNALMNIRSGEQTAMTYASDDGIDCDKESEQGRAIWILTPDREPPDALPLIRHLESNIFTNIMARFMDLGQRETGARATAEVQRDPFYLGLLSIADKMTEAWNRGPIQQLMDYNYPGVTEYPKLIATGITPQDIPVIARAAAMWAANGFITPDGPTEQWIREQMKLPDKVEDQEALERYATSAPMQRRINPAGGTGSNKDTGSGLSGSPGEGGSGEREGGDDSELSADAPWEPWRPFRPEESYTDWQTSSRLIDDARARFATLVDRPLFDIGQRLLDDAEAAVLAGDPKVAAKLRSREMGPLAEAIRQSLSEAAAGGAESMRQELGRQAAGMPLYNDRGVTGSPGWSLDDPDWLRVAHDISSTLPGLIRARAEQIVASLTGAMESAVRRLTLNQQRRGRLDIQRLIDELQRESGAAARKEALLSASEAFNIGRSAVLREAADRIEGVVYSAILDRNTCTSCLHADGTATTFGSPTFMLLDPPNQGCDGGNRCRCTWVAILKRDVS